MRVVLILLFNVSIFHSSFADRMYTFEYNSRCQKAYQNIMALRFDDALTLIHEEESQNTSNLFPVLLYDYVDALKVIIEENKTTLDKLEPNKSLRIKKIENLGDKASPYYLLFLAEIEWHWAMARIKLEQNVKAANELRSANNYLKENKKKFPDFQPNNKTLGLIHALIGTLPDKYIWVAKMLGFGGNVDLGMRELSNYLSHAQTMNTPFLEESNLLYTYLLMYVKEDKEGAAKRISQGILPTQNNLLNQMFGAMMYMHAFKTDKALSLLKNASRGSAYYALPYIDYLIGLCTVYKDPSAALPYFKKFVTTYKGRHYIKEAYQKIAWCYLLNNNETEYKKNIAYCLSKGYTLMDADKQAKKEAEVNITPNKDLLRLRLLFDGGYFTESLAMVNKMNQSDFTDLKDKCEYKYRKARIFQNLKYIDMAILAYNETIKISEETDLYFAPKSWLEMGIIYEKTKKDYPKAMQAYKKVLGYKNYEFENSFSQKAKAGIQRLSK